MEYGKHMTKEQLRIILSGKDAAAEKDIPESARWHMRHMPYRKGGGTVGYDKGKTETVSDDEERDRET